MNARKETKRARAFGARECSTQPALTNLRRDFLGHPLMAFRRQVDAIGLRHIGGERLADERHRIDDFHAAP